MAISVVPPQRMHPMSTAGVILSNTSVKHLVVNASELFGIRVGIVKTCCRAHLEVGFNTGQLRGVLALKKTDRS